MNSYMEIVSGRRRGLAAGLMRGVLSGLAVPYRALIALRNCYYEVEFGVRWLDRPCVSIGNLTTGGTGKTPVVMWLADQLLQSGKKVAIVSRGYRGRDGANDELQLASMICPGAICVAHPDRVAAGRYAVAEHDVDIVLMDDGFQHRRLGRDLDVVLIDVTRPFGYGRVLPRGLLREPVKELARAGVIVLCRASDVPLDDFKAVRDRCAAVVPHAEVLACNHVPTALVDAGSNCEDLSVLDGQRVCAIAGIGNPESFFNSINRLGIQLAGQRSFADHHHYTTDDCQAICDYARRVGADAVVTTEKDLVKLKRWPSPGR